MVSALAGREPISARIGSPGASFTSANTPNEIRRRSGTATARRRRMKWKSPARVIYRSPLGDDSPGGRAASPAILLAANEAFAISRNGGRGRPPSQGAGASPLTRRPEVTVEPGERALPRVHAMSALPQAMALARVGRDLGGDTLLAQAGVEFLRLAERRAAILAAVDHQRRRRRLVEAEERRAVESDLAIALLAERAAANELGEVMIAGVVAAPLVGDA